MGGGTDAELDWREYLVCNGVGFENLPTLSLNLGFSCDSHFGAQAMSGTRKPCKADPVAQCNAYVGNGTTIADVRAIATKKLS